MKSVLREENVSQCLPSLHHDGWRSSEGPFLRASTAIVCVWVSRLADGGETGLAAEMLHAFSASSCFTVTSKTEIDSGEIYRRMRQDAVIKNKKFQSLESSCLGLGPWRFTKQEHEKTSIMSRCPWRISVRWMKLKKENQKQERNVKTEPKPSWSELPLNNTALYLKREAGNGRRSVN